MQNTKKDSKLKATTPSEILVIHTLVQYVDNQPVARRKFSTSVREAITSPLDPASEFSCGAGIKGVSHC